MEKLAIIERQGAVRVNSCSMIVDREDVKVLEIDFHTKYAVVEACGSGEFPVLMLGARDTSLNVGTEEGPTCIEFPRFRGFHIACANVGRYSCTVAVVTDRHEVIESIFFEEDDGKCT